MRASSKAGGSGSTPPEEPSGGEDGPAVAHVDPWLGDDAGEGTARAPFRTLSRASAALGRGATLRLRAGAVFHETLRIEAAAVTVEAYGGGPPPRISGGELAPGNPAAWTASVPAEQDDSGTVVLAGVSAGAAGAPAPAAVWRLGGVEAEPLVVALDGRPGRRRHARAAMVSAGDHWWDARHRCLYLRAPDNPARLWSAIEYAVRADPVQVRAPGVVLRGLAVTHHNRDDRGTGIRAGRHAATLTLAGVECRHPGMDGADHAARPGRCDSPWNSRLDGRASYAAAPPGFGTLPVVLSGWLTPPISTAIYLARHSDPLVEVRFCLDAWTMVERGAWRRAGNPPATEAAIRRRSTPDFPSRPFGSRSRYIYQTAREPGWWLPDWPEFQPAPGMPRGVARRVRCPAGVVPPPDTDGYLAVFQPDGTVFEAYCPVILRDGTIACFCYGLTDAGGLLTAREGGVCASLLPDYAGAIRDGEISDGEVPHALALYLPERHLAKAARWPALAWDRTNAYSGTLPMGTRLAIPFTAELERHRFASAAGRAIARAAQEYGLIAVDRNGGDGLVIKVQHNLVRDAGVLGRYDAAIARDLAWIVERLRVVT